ncbi:hypothetical protein [Kibdelosporangium philippinense]|uniref:hypothetical protein n=1 Tax=Kibdelosporangium philippinense TaxID=211113 RepID=UPI003614A100
MEPVAWAQAGCRQHLVHDLVCVVQVSLACLMVGLFQQDGHDPFRSGFPRQFQGFVQQLRRPSVLVPVVQKFTQDQPDQDPADR